MSSLNLENTTLLQRYRAAIRDYIESAASLDGLVGAEFDRAYKRAEAARTVFEDLRAQMANAREGSNW